MSVRGRNASCRSAWRAKSSVEAGSASPVASYSGAIGSSEGRWNGLRAGPGCVSVANKCLVKSLAPTSAWRFFLLDRDLSQEAGELTPTMKMKRKTIEEAYADEFDRVYTDPGFAVDVEPRAADDAGS